MPLNLKITGEIMASIKKIKLHIVLFVVIIFILLFPEYKVFAEIKSLYLEDNGETYTYNTEDDGTDGPDRGRCGRLRDLRVVYAGLQK